VVAEVRACLVDVYGTLIVFDSGERFRALAAVAGVDADALRRDQERSRPDRHRGALSTAEAFRLSLAACGADSSQDAVSALVEADREIMRTVARVYDDAVPFLRQLRTRGAVIALVSNCADNTRTLLQDLELVPLADHMILSCEVGITKPAPGIYTRALEALGSPPGEAVMVDDRVKFLDGAAAVGVRGIQISREEPARDAGFPAVRGLADVIPLLI
jgi:HAD superfamily hydrolase (TIGR01509 family)